MFLDKDIKSGNIEVIEVTLEVDELKRVLNSEHLLGIQLGRYILPIDVIQEMRNTIIEGQTKDTEIAFDLCADKNNVIKAKNKISWEETYIITMGVCPKGETVIGSFHTHSHVQQKVDPSAADLLKTYRGIECIGASEEIKCFLRHNFNENDLIYLQNVEKLYPTEDETRLAEERAEFVEKYFDFVTLI